MLTVRAVYGFTVPKLADEFKACALGTADINTILENDRRTILASASLTTFAGVKTCSAPIVETEYWKYSSTQYCQIYRIRYTIVDKCAPFLSYLPGRRGLCNVLHDAAVPGFRYGNPNAACTLVESVDVTGATNSADQQHVVIYERDIFINDVTPPTSTVPANADICSYAGTPAAAPAPCSFSYTGTLTGADNCGGAGTAASDPATLTFMWRAVNAANVQVAVGTTSTVTLTNVPFGTYTICYRVTDLCGNMSQEFCYTVTGRDCKKPTIVCHDVSAELMRMAVGSPSAGMVTVWATDLLASPLFDNCTARTFLDSKLVAVRASANPTNTYPTGAASVNFTCADLTGTNPVPVQLWTIDEAGNADFCLAYVTVQDNLNNACSAGATQSTIAGTVASENGAVVRDVAVAATNAGVTAGTATTSAAGTYSIATNARGANVQVRATKTISDDKYAGVTTYDIALISKHILDIAPLSTPYKMIAADVDRSGDINANDMLQLRRFILHISSDLLAGNFRFVDKSYSFRNPANPFAEDFAEVANLTSVPVSAQANFVAVKIGDVNQDYTAQLTNGLVVRGARTLVLNANDMDVVAGNEYTVNVASDNFNAAALQGTFTLNNATVKSVKAGNLNNMSDVNFGIFADKVTAAWNGTATATADVFTINFVANKSGKLSEILSIGSALTPAVAYDAQGNDMNVTLKFNTGKVSGGEFALYANTPNPVAQSTKIGFNMPKEGAAKMTFYTVDGKVLRVVNGDYKAGYNEINVAKSDLGTTGVVYYRLETADQAATKKMIIIE